MRVGVVNAVCVFFGYVSRFHVAGCKNTAFSMANLNGFNVRILQINAVQNQDWKLNSGAKGRLKIPKIYFSLNCQHHLNLL